MKMDQKLMNVSFRNGNMLIVEVIVEKETEKQFTIRNTSRRILNKSDMNRHLDYYGIYCYESDLKKLATEYIENRKSRLEMEITTRNKELQNLENSVGKLN
jgi:hypothetical protein